MRDVWAAAALLAFGLGAAVQARGLAVGSIASPGPGFFPLALAAALVVAAAALLARALRGARLRADRGPTAGAPPARGGARRVAVVIGALGVYAFVLERLGFGLATFLLMLVLFRAVQAHGWARAVGGSALAAALAHVVFKTWLGVRLPPGLWGF